MRGYCFVAEVTFTNDGLSRSFFCASVCNFNRAKLLFRRIPLSYCFEETTRFDVKALFARGPVTQLIKPGDITQEF